MGGGSGNGKRDGHRGPMEPLGYIPPAEAEAMK
jgi:hypothetical protein